MVDQIMTPDILDWWGWKWIFAPINLWMGYAIAKTCVEADLDLADAHRIRQWWTRALFVSWGLLAVLIIVVIAIAGSVEG